jgi:hypothetical protein
VWIFFDQRITAYKARQLGKLLLSQAGITTRKTFDRMFPSQDEHTGKGFGNLICLPLQGKAVLEGNTVFVNAGGEVYPNQWQFLESVKRVSLNDIDCCMNEKTKIQYQLNPITAHSLRESSPRYQAEQKKDEAKTEITTEVDIEPTVATTQGQEVQATLASSIVIKNLWLPDKLYRFLKKELNFPNPEFYVKERFGYSTWQTARFIKTLEVFPDHISAPLGFLNKLLAFIKKEQLTIEIQDERATTKRVQFPSTLKLRADQQKILKSLIGEDRSILEAHPGFGKTMVAIINGESEKK